MKTRIAALIALLVGASCAPPAAKPPAPVDNAAPPAAAPVAPSADNPSGNATESVPLQVIMTGQTTDGRVMKLRAKVVNPHAEPVEGVRLQLVFLVPAEDSAKVLEIQQKEMGSTIAPGDSTMLRWDVESMYLSGSGRFLLAAYPKRLGGRDMPPPDNWNE